MGKNKLLGLLPRVTGLDCVVWLPRRSDRNMYIEVTPDPDYAASEKASIVLEPDIIERTEGMPRQLKDDLIRFVEENLDLIEEYWLGRLDGAEVVARLSPLRDGRD